MSKKVPSTELVEILPPIRGVPQASCPGGWVCRSEERRWSMFSVIKEEHTLLVHAFLIATIRLIHNKLDDETNWHVTIYGKDGDVRQSFPETVDLSTLRYRVKEEALRLLSSRIEEIRESLARLRSVEEFLNRL